MPEAETHTALLLRRFHAGDLEALRALLTRHLGWIRNEVHRQLGAALRKRAEEEDFVQDALVNVLRYAPRFVIQDDHHFRALLARVVLNVLKDKSRWYAARRRRRAQEQPLPSDSAIDLGGARSTATSPSQAADRSEREAWVRFGVELLPEADREVIVLREWDGGSFAEVGARLGIAEDAARMRYLRAVRRLGDLVTKLRVDGAAAKLDAPDDADGGGG